MAYFGNTNSYRLFSRVEPRTLFVLLWFSVCLLVVALMYRNGGRSMTPSAPPSQSQHIGVVTKVLVPINSIEPGVKLTSNLFKVEDRSIEGIESKVIRNFDSINGAYSNSLIASNVPLVNEYITFETPANALTAKIPEGYRAVTISVNEETGVEGWVRPGARVDVVWLSSLRGRPSITTIVENAEILSAERSIDKDPTAKNEGAPGHITLLVSIKDAQRIQLAKSAGSLSLSLRGTKDRNEIGSETITVEGLLRTSETMNQSDATGWIKVGDKSFEINTEGKIKPSSSADEVLKQVVELQQGNSRLEGTNNPQVGMVVQPKKRY